MSEVTVRFAITGMHCSSCSMLVDLTLSDVEGVVSSKTDHVNCLSVVVFDDSRVTPEQLLGAIQGAGYEAVRID